MSPPSPGNSRQPYIVGSRCHAASSKHVLAVALGATENAAVVKALLADLVERGLQPDIARLFSRFRSTKGWTKCSP